MQTLRVPVAAKLKARFGLGDDPVRRQSLFARLERVVCDHGDAALMIIRSAAMEAVRADRPDRWFCAAVVRRLKEHGLWEAADPFGS